MTYHPKKMAVLNQIRQHSDPISLPGLLSMMGEGYAERTVRRWLSEMMADGLVRKSGHKRGTLYSAIPASSEDLLQTEPQTPFSQECHKIIEQVRRPLFERVPVAYIKDWLNEYKPNQTSYFSTANKSQLLKAGNRVHNHEPAGTYAHKIYHRLLIDLTYNSARLEGNTYSLLETKKLLLQGESASNKLDEEKVMILNHKEAIRYLVDNAGRLSINQETICTLHYLLADGLVPNQYAGKIRDYGVRIGGSTYIPFENPIEILKNMNLMTEKASQISDPFEQSLFLLIHVAYLQAFVDVNKRTSRLSANIPLIRDNLVPLSFNDVNKNDYASAMIAIYEMNNPQPLIELYVHSYLRTCHLYDATIESLGFDEVRVRYRKVRREIIKHIIESHLIGEEMQKYILLMVDKNIQIGDRELFLKDMQEEIANLGPERITGLGISVSQLRAWLKKYNKK